MSHITLAVVLPFVINLPNGTYVVSIDGCEHPLALSDDTWMLRTQTEFVEELVPSAVYGKREELEHLRSKSLEKPCVEKAGSWVQETFSLPAQADVDAADDHASRGNDGFLSAVNLLIQAYRVVRGDPFVEPISPTLAVIYRWAWLNGRQVQRPTRIGKAPPLLRRPWLPDASGCEMQELMNFISDKPIPFHRIQLIQALTYIQRSETRAAIMEARGAFENAIATKISECLAARGESEEEVKRILKKDGFKDRESNLVRLTGRRLGTEDEQLNARLENWQDELRHEVIHRDRVPTVQEAEQAYRDHQQAVDWVDGLDYRPQKQSCNGHGA